MPESLLPHLKKELADLEENNLIRKVPADEPTEWCSGIIVHPKMRAGKIIPGRIKMAVDFRNLNKFAKRHYYQTMTPIEAARKIKNGKAKKLTTADIWRGFHLLPLHEESIPLTTFITPYGRYQCLTCPYGVNSVPEQFEAAMDEKLDGLPNLTKVVDDTLIYSGNEKSHEEHVRAFLDRCREKQIRLNPDKFDYMKEEVGFAGLQINENGYSIQPHITQAVKDFPTPTDKTSVRSFTGLCNQMAPFNKRLAEVLKPFHELTKDKIEFQWTIEHEKDFEEAKRILSSPEVMAFYDPQAPLRIFTDASKLNGIGYLLQQQQPDGHWAPLMVGSRSLQPAETRYAPIELEMLGVYWGIRRSSTFLIGAPHFEVFTDHSPLVPIINRKRLDEIENRRIREYISRLMDFNFTVHHIPGKENLAADALSRHPIPSESETDHHPVVNAFTTEEDMPVRLQAVKDASDKDFQYKLLQEWILQGRPEQKSQLPTTLHEYWNTWDNLSIAEDGFTLVGSRLVIPKSLRANILQELHTSHLGVEATKRRARLAIHWPGINSQIEDICKTCKLCEKSLPSLQKETLQSPPRPTRPFEYISADWYQANGLHFLCIEDWRSNWFYTVGPMTTKSISMITDV